MVPQWVGGGLSLQPATRLLFVGALWPALDSLEGLFDEVSWTMSIVELLYVSGVPEEEKVKKQRKRREERVERKYRRKGDKNLLFSSTRDEKGRSRKAGIGGCRLRAVSHVSNEENKEKRQKPYSL